MRHRKRDGTRDPIRRGDARQVSVPGPPVVAHDVDCPSGRPAIDQIDHVADELVGIERPSGRRRRVAAQPRCQHPVPVAAQLGEERRCRWRVVGKPV